MANIEDHVVAEVKNDQIQRKPRILCLHGFRTSAAILKKLILRWPENVLDQLDVDFLDAPYPAQDQSAVEGIFDPPFLEWFQSDKVKFMYLEILFLHSENIYSFVQLKFVVFFYGRVTQNAITLKNV